MWARAAACPLGLAFHLSGFSVKAAIIAEIVVALLLTGLVFACAEGFVPTTWQQLLLAVLVIGPLLLFGEGIAELVCYGTARLVLPLLTLGRLRAERFDETHSFPWYGVARIENGRFVASTDASSLLGAFIIAAFIAVAIAVALQRPF
jgi:membrane-bound ClpP family serine protease